ncbi:MAG: tripartite tricarboxylate transporter substrate binding protein [Betaproteobacteria bacterium]|nr:tripartite tricarboxylate transporter substrate binding protein [Betaproteobacteria bacterium]
MKRMIAGALGALLASGALAQGTFPSRQVTMIVGFAPGGGTDTAARIIAKKLSENLGQPVVVDNRPGAGGNIAQELGAKAVPDGHTIVLASPGPLTVAPHMIAKLPYDAQGDFAPITMAVSFPNVLVVNVSVPAKTLAEFVALANASPGKITYGSSGIGGIGHLAGELLKTMTRANIVHVPYKGGAPAMTDLLGGQIHSIFATPITAGPHIKNGKIRAIATTGATRGGGMPEVPTVAESGYPGYEAVNWYCYVVPAKTPRDVQNRLHKELTAVLTNADIRSQLASHGMDSVPGTPDALQRYIEREYETWGKVVREAKISAN